MSQDIGSDLPCPACLHEHFISPAGEMGLGEPLCQAVASWRSGTGFSSVHSGRVLVGRWVTQLRAPPLAKKQAIIIQCPVGVGVTFPVSSITTSDVLG